MPMDAHIATGVRLGSFEQEVVHQLAGRSPPQRRAPAG